MTLPLEPVVRVVIPCRDEADYIEGCLASLVAADRTGIKLEVFVCDGMSADGTRAIVQRMSAEHPWIVLLDNEARTTPQAMNLGLRKPGYDVGIILGAHAEVEPDFPRANVAALREHPDAGCVGGIIQNVYESNVARAIGAAMTHPFGVGSAHFRTGLKEGAVDTVAFGAYRREVFERVGYFDERLVRNQDDEFNFRVTRAGFGIFLSRSIRSRYFVRGSFERLFAQYRQYGYWKVFVNRIHGTVTTFRQVVPALFVLAIVAGQVLAWIFPVLWPLYAAFVGLYIIAAIISAWGASERKGDMLLVLRAFVILHSSYGIGYLQGIVEFILLRRIPRESAKTMTR